MDGFQAMYISEACTAKEPEAIVEGGNVCWHHHFHKSGSSR
jgi:hypothetical protein